MVLPYNLKDKQKMNNQGLFIRRKSHGKFRAGFVGLCDLKCSIVYLGDPFRDRQTESGTASDGKLFLPRASFADAVESFKKLSSIFRWNAFAVVFEFDAVIAVQFAGGDCDRAFGMFDGIVEQIYKQPFNNCSSACIGISHLKSLPKSRPRLAASDRNDLTTSAGTSSRYIKLLRTGSSPASARDKVSRSSMIADMRSASFYIIWIVSRYSAGSRSVFDKLTSASSRTIATGVRSSCDASAINRCCCPNVASRRASIRLKAAAKRPSSSSLFCTGSRSYRLRALISSALPLISAIGRKDLLASK